MQSRDRGSVLALHVPRRQTFTHLPGGADSRHESTVDARGGYPTARRAPVFAAGARHLDHVAFVRRTVPGRTARGRALIATRWVGYLILGTLFGAASSLYDKLLLGRLALAPATVQAWFSIYLLALFLPLALLWWFARGRRNGGLSRFEFRPSMILLALCLLCADFAYFCALREQAGLISLVASLRRGSTLIAFAAGVFVFKESNGWKKLPPVAGIVLGIALTLLG